MDGFIEGKKTLILGTVKAELSDHPLCEHCWSLQKVKLLVQKTMFIQK
jgi:hypothetical protein